MPGYLISGLPPGERGVGRFLSRLTREAAQAGWKVICRPERTTGGSAWYALRLLGFHIRLRTIRGTDLVIVHPQSLRWRTFFRLASVNRLALFVVDNSFFCIQSYNYRGQEWMECLDCLGDVGKCHASCSPFPVFYSREENLSYLHQLSRLAAGIRFFAQNPSQAALLRKHFGPGIEILVVGMITDEFMEEPLSGKGSGGYDVVFHGALDAAKGAAYAMALARHLPELEFLIPGREEEGVRIAGREDLPKNVTFKEMTWETGLKKAVEKCRMVLCPSLWSAPIEGALVKSIIHNGRVAVFRSEYGYQADLPEDLLVRLDDDLKKSADIVRRALDVELKVNPPREFVKDLLENSDLRTVFKGQDTSVIY